MIYVLVCAAALLASCLTFFTGFGLGTLLMPVFAIFFAVEVAVASTAVVHLLNGAFKLVLVGRHADLKVALRFGLPAILAALAGARLLVLLADLPAIASYELAGRTFTVTSAKLGIGGLMIAFAAIELSPRTAKLEVAPRWLPLGGVVSGFFGGLSGHQGAFRSAFLVRSGLSPAAFVATGAAIALMIDVARLAMYLPRLALIEWRAHGPLLAAATASALAGALLGARLLEKATIGGLRIGVSVLLFVIALALIAGAI